MAKKWSEISSEEWFQNLSTPEQIKVADQYKKYTKTRDSFINQVISTKNRPPSKTEIERFQKAYKTPVFMQQQDEMEKGLKTGEILSNVMPGAKEIKLAAMGATGLGLTATNMMMRKGTAKVPGIAKQQGGWIGSAASKNTPEMVERLSKAQEYKLKGMDEKAIWEETGIFDYGAGPRYFDLDVVDDYVKNKGNLLKEGSGFISLRGQVGDKYPSLFKHISPGTQNQTYVFQDKILDSQGLFDPNTGRIYYRDNPAGVLPHEIQHAIQKEGRLPARGYNTTAALEIVQQSPKLLAKLEQRNKKFKNKEEIPSWGTIPSGREISKKEVAYDIYRHNAGEVEATINQVYHNFISNAVKQGKSAEEIKKAVQKQDPYKFLEKRYTRKKIWKEGDVKVSAASEIPKHLEKPYEIIDRKTGKVVARTKTLSGARRSVDRLDNEYGGSRYTHRRVGEKNIDIEPDTAKNLFEQEEKLSSKLRDEEPLLNVKLSKEELEKMPAIFREQAQ